jgi:hypothetical protein
VKIQDQTIEQGTYRPLWQHPWKYFESFIISFSILITGVAIETITGGRDLSPIGMPYNIYIAFAFASLLVFVHFNYRDYAVVKWLSSIPAAISAIALFSLLVLLLGFIPQDQLHTRVILKLTGLSHIKTSWPFLLTQVYFLTVLGMVTIRRIIPFKGRNIGFFLNHCGLWIILVAGCLGSGDLKRLNISLLEKEQGSNIGVSVQGTMYKLPFTLKLIEFKIDEYNPKLALINAKTGQFKTGKDKTLPVAEKGAKTKINDWDIEVTDYLPQAIIRDSMLQSSDDRGNYPAAYIKAIRKTSHDTVKGWISTGSYLQEPVFLMLKEDNVLVLTTPEARKYSSRIEAKDDEQHTDTITLEVNKPLHIKGWMIYQVDYDRSKGKWSSLSVLEAVNDPWLPVIYSGIFLLLAGAVYLFWIGRGKK